MLSGELLESNTAAGYSDLVVASKGRLVARGFEQKENTLEWKEWRDVSGVLVGKPIRFLAYGGPAWVIAASEKEVFRSPSYPLGNWEMFNTGLPNGFRVEGISQQSQHFGNIGLVTDQGLFTYYDGVRWQPQPSFGKPKFYADIVLRYAEGSLQRAYIVTGQGVWMHAESHDVFGEAIGAILSSVIMVVFSVLSIILGIILGVRTWGRLTPSE